MPSEENSPTSSAICSFNPDTRIIKNSSRLVENMARNFNRSSTGQALSVASSSTRRLNSSQLSSRLKRGEIPSFNPPPGCSSDEVTSIDLEWESVMSDPDYK